MSALPACQATARSRGRERDEKIKERVCKRSMCGGLGSVEAVARLHSVVMGRNWVERKESKKKTQELDVT